MPRDNAAYRRVTAARAKGRRVASDYIDALFTGFFEMHGDRHFGDDPAVVGGIAEFKGQPVTVIALEKGHDLQEKSMRNFASAHPEGYRKALRHMRLAEKFGRPVICIVDTAGAYCGVEAEERGQGTAIAENLMAMASLRVPIISLFIGEGGSGGALALAVADRILMLENSVYSVISPEGCASILWKDTARAPEAAAALKLTPKDLRAAGVIDHIIGEDDKLFAKLRTQLAKTLARLCAQSTDALLEARYQRFRKVGTWE